MVGDRIDVAGHEHKSTSKIGCPVTGTDVAPVDHRAEFAMVDDHIADVEVAVQPDVFGRRRDRTGCVEDCRDAIPVEPAVDSVHIRGEGCGSINEWATTELVERSISRRSGVQLSKERAKHRGGVCRIIESVANSIGSSEERRDRPRPGVVQRWCTGVDGRRNGHVELSCKDRQPRLFVQDQWGGHLSVRHSYDHIITQAEVSVVPTP